MTDTTSPTLVPNPGLTARARGCGLPAYDIPLGLIEPDPDQPRGGGADPEAMGRLARSLAAHGQIQPISVRRGDEPFRYVIVTGERRWRAAVSAGLSTISAVILGGSLTASQRLELQLVENLLREDLSPIDQARAFRTLMDHNDWSARRLGEVLNLHGSSISRALTLLDLPGPVQDQVDSGRIAPSVAVEVARLVGADRQTALAERVVSEGLSRAETAEAVRVQTSRPAEGSPTRRVFETSVGRVTVELDPGTGADALLTAFIEAAGIVKNERMALRPARADAGPPRPADSPPEPGPEIGRRERAVAPGERQGPHPEADPKPVGPPRPPFDLSLIERHDHPPAGPPRQGPARGDGRPVPGGGTGYEGSPRGRPRLV